MIMDWHYINILREIGFTREQAEMIAEGRETEALPEDEVLQFCHAWENDRVAEIEPLVEKYGWEELTERLAASVENDES